MPRKLIDAASLPVRDLWLHDDTCAGRPVRAVLVEDIEKAGAVEVPRWISVTESPPLEPGKRDEAYCLVFVQNVKGGGNFFTPAVFYGDSQTWDLDFVREHQREIPHYIVTHWMDMNRDVPEIPVAELLGVASCEHFIKLAIKRGRITGVDNGDEYAAYFSPDNAEHCICCGEVIPEGRQVCPACEGGVT